MNIRIVTSTAIVALVFAAVPATVGAQPSVSDLSGQISVCLMSPSSVSADFVQRTCESLLAVLKSIVQELVAARSAVTIPVPNIPMPNSPVSNTRTQCPDRVAECMYGYHAVRGAPDLINGCNAETQCALDDAPPATNPTTGVTDTELLPDAIVTLYTTPSAGQAPLNVTFTGSILNARGTYTLDFGDGEKKQIDNLCSIVLHCIGRISVSHSYTNTGTFLVTMYQLEGRVLTRQSVTVSRAPTVTQPPTTQSQSGETGSSCTTPWGGKIVRSGETITSQPYFTNGNFTLSVVVPIMKCSNGTWLQCDYRGNDCVLRSASAGDAAANLASALTALTAALAAFPALLGR